jgi:hypothetical protein
MDMTKVLMLLAIPALFALGLYGWLEWFAVSNTADGEHYRKLRMQGPFAPDSDGDPPAR